MIQKRMRANARYDNASTSGTSIERTIHNAAAGMVNGLAALNQGAGFPSEIVLKLENGKEIARWLLSDIRAVSRADPEVVSGV